MIIKDYKDVERVKVGEGGEKAYLRWMIGEKENPPNFYLRLVEIEEGGHSPYHQHNYEHEVFVLEGEGVVVDEQNKEHPISRGKAVYVPPSVKHQFRNTGKGVLSFICVIPKIS